MIIHRHTGGLEIRQLHICQLALIHRHTGGLEIIKEVINNLIPIHRHTSGLESQRPNSRLSNHLHPLGCASVSMKMPAR